MIKIGCMPKNGTPVSKMRESGMKGNQRLTMYVAYHVRCLPCTLRHCISVSEIEGVEVISSPSFTVQMGVTVGFQWEFSGKSVGIQWESILIIAEPVTKCHKVCFL